MSEAKISEIEGIIKANQNGSALTVNGRHEAAREIWNLLGRSSSKRWGVYAMDRSGVMEPVKTGFASKTKAIEWWRVEHKLGQSNVKSRGTKNGYVQIDLTGKTGPVYVREEIAES